MMFQSDPLCIVTEIALVPVWDPTSGVLYE